MNPREIIIPLNPVACPRPRVTRFGTYYPKKYNDYKAEAVRLIGQADIPLEGPLALELTFYVQRPRTTKLTHPHPDIDNFMKSAMDALTQCGVWGDDKQVVSVTADKQFTTEAAHTFIRITQP